jgi:glycogenin glucosyltransferase
MNNHAYVTFIIRNDSYLPGALVFGYALRLQKTTKDLICIVSENVTEKAVHALQQIYDDVLVIDEVFVPHKRRHERQDRPFLFSRFNAFRLGLDGDLNKQYDKIVVADCDVLPLRDFDTLFDIETPAGIINEKKEYCMEYKDGTYIIPDTVDTEGTWNWHAHYHDVPHGTLIPKYITDRIDKDKENMGVNASIYVFKPSMTLYNSIIDDVLDPHMQDEISTYNWPEMQYITKKLSGQWTNLDLRYSSFNGYPKIDVLYGIHFAGLKPWSIKNKSVTSFAKFEDYQLWNHTFVRMMKEIPTLREVGKLRRIETFISEMLSTEKYQFKKKQLPFLAHFFE